MRWLPEIMSTKRRVVMIRTEYKYTSLIFDSPSILYILPQINSIIFILQSIQHVWGIRLGN